MSSFLVGVATSANLGPIPIARPGFRLIVFQADAPQVDPLQPWNLFRNVSGEYAAQGGVNSRPASDYQVTDGDLGALIEMTNAGANTVELPDPTSVVTFFNCGLLTTGAATVTVIGGALINGNASFPLAAGASCWFYSDGVSYRAIGATVQSVATIATVAQTTTASLSVLASFTHVDGTPSGGTDATYTLPQVGSSPVLTACIFAVKNLGAGQTGSPVGGKVILKGNGSELIDDANTFELPNHDDFVIVVRNAAATGWKILSKVSAAGVGTVTTTGSPVSGEIAKFSGSTSVTNGDLSGDVTTSGTLVTTLGNIPTATPMAGSVLATNISAPGTPASGKDSIYVDSTDKRLHDKNDAGTIGTTVVASSAPANQFATGISAAGVVSYASVPGGGGGGLTLLEQYDASSSATLDFTTAITAAYDEYIFELINLNPANNGIDLLMRMGTGAGPTWDTSAIYDWTFIASNAAGGSGVGAATGDTFFHLLAGQANTATYGSTGHVRLYRPGDTTFYKQATGQFCYKQSSGNFSQNSFGAVYRNAAAVTGVRFVFQTGAIAIGTIRCYGIAKT